MNKCELIGKLKRCPGIPETKVSELAEQTCIVTSWFADWVSNKGKAKIKFKVLDECMNKIERYSCALYELNERMLALRNIHVGFDNVSFFERLGSPSSYGSVFVDNDGCSLEDLDKHLQAILALKRKAIKHRDDALRSVGIAFYDNGRLKEEVSYFSTPFINQARTFTTTTLLNGIEQVVQRYKNKNLRFEVISALKFTWFKVMASKHHELCTISLSDSHPFFQYAAIVLDDEPINIRKSYHP